VIEATSNRFIDDSVCGGFGSSLDVLRRDDGHVEKIFWPVNNFMDDLVGNMTATVYGKRPKVETSHQSHLLRVKEYEKCSYCTAQNVNLGGMMTMFFSRKDIVSLGQKAESLLEAGHQIVIIVTGHKRGDGTMVYHSQSCDLDRLKRVKDMKKDGETLAIGERGWKDYRNEPIYLTITRKHEDVFVIAEGIVINRELGEAEIRIWEFEGVYMVNELWLVSPN
jgi:hypothetical protein